MNIDFRSIAYMAYVHKDTDRATAQLIVTAIFNLPTDNPNIWSKETVAFQSKTDSCPDAREICRQIDLTISAMVKLGDEREPARLETIEHIESVRKQWKEARDEFNRLYV